MRLTALPVLIRRPLQDEIVAVILRDNAHCVLCGTLASELHPLGQSLPFEAWNRVNMVLLCSQCCRRSSGPAAPEVAARCRHYLRKKVQLKDAEDRVSV